MEMLIMRKNHLVAIVCGLAVIVFLAMAANVMAADSAKKSSPTKEKKLTKEQIPAVVLTAFQKAYPKAVIKGAGQETKDSVTCIEIESVDGAVKRDIQYTIDGKVVEIEESIDTKALPDAALNSIAKEYPKGKIEKAERITQGDKIQYEVIVAVGKDRTEIVFDASGKTIKTETSKEDEDQD
jgi:hypothetical protein